MSMLYSCSKNDIILSPDAIIHTSADSIKFDTVFTTTGSVTRSFKIFNDNDKKIVLSEIRLMGGPLSAFDININGMATDAVQQISINPNDSIYVFVSINAHPNNQQQPFIIQDSIKISWNGNQSFVQLEAYGQNAHFLDGVVISGQVTWDNDLPYVLTNGLYVDTGAILTINPGCKIFSHANAPIVVDGTLVVNGEINKKVFFSGDRLDEDYLDLPASWPGIKFRSLSSDNHMRFAIVKNAYEAISVFDPSVNNNPKLTLHQCEISNAYQSGLYASHSNVLAENSLISNCGNNLKIVNGGQYNFSNCTVVGYSNAYLTHNHPVLQIDNYNHNSGTLQTQDLSANFVNCIFWGENGGITDEVVTQKEGTTIFDVKFQNCIFKNQTDPSSAQLQDVIRNADPIFDSVDVNHNFYDFRTTHDPSAPGIDMGVTTPFSKDLDDLPRSTGVATDIGCYEKQ